MKYTSLSPLMFTENMICPRLIKGFVVAVGSIVGVRVGSGVLEAVGSSVLEGAVVSVGSRGVAVACIWGWIVQAVKKKIETHVKRLKLLIIHHPLKYYLAGSCLNVI
jgi:hypothetical protein